MAVHDREIYHKALELAVQYTKIAGGEVFDHADRFKNFLRFGVANPDRI